MEMFIFFAGLIMVLIVSSGLAISLLFLGDLNPNSAKNQYVHYSLKDLTHTKNLKKLVGEVKHFQESHQ